MRRRVPEHRSTSFKAAGGTLGGDSPRAFRERHRNAMNGDHQCSSLAEHKAVDLEVTGSTPVAEPTLKSVTEQVRRPRPARTPADARDGLAASAAGSCGVRDAVDGLRLRKFAAASSPWNNAGRTKGGVRRPKLRDEPRQSLDPAGSAGGRAGRASACVV